MVHLVNQQYHLYPCGNLWKMLQEEVLVDVTIGCDVRHVKAHRVVLAAASTYFLSIFVGNSCTHPIVILKDVLADDLITILKFVYQGEVLVPEDRLTSLFSAAQILSVTSLIRSISDYCAPTSDSLNQMVISDAEVTLLPDQQTGAGQLSLPAEPADDQKQQVHAYAFAKCAAEGNVVEMSITDQPFPGEQADLPVTEPVKPEQPSGGTGARKPGARRMVPSDSLVEKGPLAPARKPKRSPSKRKPKKSPSGRKPGGLVNSHYTTDGDNVYKCIHCGKSFTRSPGTSTSHLLRHLKDAHQLSHKSVSKLTIKLPDEGQGDELSQCHMENQ